MHGVGRVKILELIKSNNPYPANIHLFNNGNTRKRYEICSELTIKAPVLVFLLLTLNISHLFLVLLMFTLNK